MPFNSYQEQRADRKARISADPNHKAHGTYNGYVNWGCRCSRCKHAATLYNKVRRHKNDLSSIESQLIMHEQGCPAIERAYYGCSCDAIRLRNHTEALNRHTEEMQRQSNNQLQRIADLEQQILELKKNQS